MYDLRPLVDAPLFGVPEPLDVPALGFDVELTQGDLLPHRGEERAELLDVLVRQ